MTDSIKTLDYVQMHNLMKILGNIFEQLKMNGTDNQNRLKDIQERLDRLEKKVERRLRESNLSRETKLHYDA